MEKELVKSLFKTFNDYAYETEDGVEFWYARDLQGILGYAKWENFNKVINKAKEACRTAGFQCDDHFLDVGKKVQLGSGAEREIEDMMLSRYACYLIAQNGDPGKSEIAFAQTYFAAQTRKQELIEERLVELDRIKTRKQLTESEKRFSAVLFEHGIENLGFGRIRSKGDQALFNGYTTKQMKERLDVPEGRALADFLPSVTIAAKQLATEMTTYNIVKEDIEGEPLITRYHVHNNKNVRDALEMSGIKPEKLPPETDLKKIEKKINRSEKQIEADADNARIKK